MSPEDIQEALIIVGWILRALLIVIQGVVAYFLTVRGRDLRSYAVFSAVLLLTGVPFIFSTALWLEGPYWLAGLTYIVGWVMIVYANKLVERREAIEVKQEIAKSLTDGSQP